MFRFILIKRREVSKYLVTLCCTANAMLKVIKCFNSTFTQSIRFCFDNSSWRSGLNMAAFQTKEELNIPFSKISSRIKTIDFRIFYKVLDLSRTEDIFSFKLLHCVKHCKSSIDFIKRKYHFVKSIVFNLLPLLQLFNTIGLTIISNSFNTKSFIDMYTKGIIGLSV